MSESNDKDEAIIAKEREKIYGMTENEREAFILAGNKHHELIDFAKELQFKVMSAIGQKPPISAADTVDAIEKRYLEALECKEQTSKNPSDLKHSINIELADMARTAVIAARWKTVIKIIGARRKADEYDPDYHIDRLYRLFDNISKIREYSYIAQQNKRPKEYLDTLEYCFEQALEKYFKFFLDGISKALENQDAATVNRLRIVCGLHARLVSTEQKNNPENSKPIAMEDKVIHILSDCIKTMEQKLIK